MSVAFNNGAVNNPGDASSVSFSYAASSGSDRFLTVGASYGGATPVSVTFGGVSLTLEELVQFVYVASKAGAPSGTNTLNVTWDGGYNFGMVVVGDWTGVDQTTPKGVTLYSIDGGSNTTALSGLTCPANGAIAAWGWNNGNNAGKSADAGTSVIGINRRGSGHDFYGGYRLNTGTISFTGGSYTPYNRMGGFPINPVASLASYSLTATQASVALTGQGVTLTRGQRKLIATKANLTLIGQSTALRVSRRAAATVATMALSGQAVALKSQRKLNATYAVVGLAGQSVQLSRSGGPPPGGYVLPATQAAVALSGQGVTLRATRRMAASQASLAITAPAAALRATRRLTAALAGIALTPQSVGLRKSLRLTAAPASLALTGQAVALSHGFGPRVLVADTALYALTAQDAVLSQQRSLVAGPGFVELRPQAITLARTARTMTLAFGSVALAPQQIAFSRYRRSQLATAYCVLNAQAVILRRSGGLPPGYVPSAFRTYAIAAENRTFLVPR